MWSIKLNQTQLNRCNGFFGRLAATIIVANLIFTKIYAQDHGRLPSTDFIKVNNKDMVKTGFVASPEIDGWTFSDDDAIRVHSTYSISDLYAVNRNSKYIYLHVNEFMPTSTVYRDGPVSQLDTSMMPQISNINGKTDLGIFTLDEYIMKSGLQGIIVLHHGKIVYERYPRMRNVDKHIYFSLSKTLVATAVSLLEDAGKINIQDTIAKYLVELCSVDWGKVKIVDILNMTSGMTGRQFDDPKMQNDSDYIHFASNIGTAVKTRATEKSIWDILRDMKKQKEPGLAFEYSSVNSVILSLLVERISGVKFNEFISEHIWKKMGAEADGYIGLSEQGITSSAATMNSTLRDLARYGLLFTPSWNIVSNEKIISEKYLNNIQKGGANPLAYDKGAMGRQIISEIGEKPDHNSFQWDAVMADGDFFKFGTNGQGLYISTSKDLVIACFSYSNHASKAYLRAIATSGLFDR